MVNIFSFKNKQELQTTIQRSKLSFMLENSGYSEKYEEVDLKIGRTLAKVGSLNVYLVGREIGEIKKFELEAMEAAKFSIIDTISKQENIDLQDFDMAKQIAISELIKKVTAERAEKLAHIVVQDTVGYGPISILFDDRQNIEEIEINSPTSPISIYHARYGRCVTNLRFAGEEQFRHTINRFIYETEKELNETTPIIDVQVGDARLHAQMKPYSLNGACATIRLNGRKEVNISYLTKNNTVDFDQLAYLWLAIECRANIIIAGAPASGKTTLLLSLLSFVPRYLRAITIEEDVNEIKFYSNMISSVSLYGSKLKNSVSTKEQVVNALRMRPDLLVVGEMRGDEAKELFTGANLGIPFFTTMHSNEGGISIIKRLLVRPMGIESQALSYLDISIQMGHTGMRSRAIKEISEYKWLSRAEILGAGIKVGEDMVKIEPIVTNSAINCEALSESKILENYAKNNRTSVSLAIKELKHRSQFLREMCCSPKSTLELIEEIYRYKVPK
ncbi:MAG: ATPase, T2SS/T4P/T4SS family [Candidatus Micrarchaeales archaeon]